MKHIDLILAIAALLLAGICQPVFAQQAEGAVGPVQDAIASEEQVAVDYSSVVHFGGPASTGAQVKSDAEEKESPFRFRGLTRYLQPYYDFKNRLNKERGFSFGADYNLMYQDASKSLGEDDAAGGVFRLYATWQLTGRGTSNNGSLVFKAENRHRIETAIAPQQLGSEFGYAGLTAITYSNAGTLLTNFYWLQSFNNDRIAFVAGIVDATDYVDVYGLVNPWTDFSNLAFSTNPTIPVPDQGGGAAIRGMLTDNLYLVGGIADTNGDPADPSVAFDSFFNVHEYLAHLEFGWVASVDDRYNDNIHVTVWQADQRTVAQTPEGKGVALSFNRKINERWLPFVRLGYSDGGGSAFLDRSLSAGLGYFPAKRSDTLGVGVNWGRPSEQLYGPNQDDQITAEMYYRFQLFQHTTVTPDIQYLKNPVLYPEKTSVWVAGLRARIVF